MAKIYTKTGDQGETGLLGGKRVPKNHVRVEAYGTLDEANAIIGLILARFSYFTHYEELVQVQHMLFEMGAALADPSTRSEQPQNQDIAHLEELIDELTASLPPLTQFILPGGTELAAYLHIARTIVRRGERRVITVQQHQPVRLEIIKYLNRLSDYLFTLARAVNYNQGFKDKVWQPTHPRSN